MKWIIAVLLIDFVFRLVKYGPFEFKSFVSWLRSKFAKPYEPREGI